MANKMPSRTTGTIKNTVSDPKDRRATSFVTGATAGIIGLLASIVGGVIYLSVAMSPGWGDEVAVLTSQNRTWLITGAVVFLGLIAFFAGGAVALHCLRPHIDAGYLASATLAVGGAVLMVTGLLMMSAMNTFVSENAANFSIRGLGILDPASGLAASGVLAGVLGILVGGVWLLIRLVRSGARRISVTP